MTLDDAIMNQMEFEMAWYRHIVDWAHDEDVAIPESITGENRDLVESNLEFFKLVNDHVSKKGPFPPLKLFKNACQSFYSKTKPGVDGLTQQREVLANSSSCLSWEQMVVTKGIHTSCAHNAHVAYKLYMSSGFVESAEE